MPQSRIQDQNFIYVLARGEGLKLIQQVEQPYLELEDSIRSSVSPYGVTVKFLDKNFKFENVAADTPGFDGSWPKNDNYELRKKLKAYIDLGEISDAFNKACGKLSGEGHEYITREKYAYEKLDDIYIIRCPESRFKPNVYYIPRGSVVITEEAYRSMKQARLHKPTVRVQAFPNSLE